MIIDHCNLLSTLNNKKVSEEEEEGSENENKDDILRVMCSSLPALISPVGSFGKLKRFLFWGKPMAEKYFHLPAFKNFISLLLPFSL